MKRTTYTVTAKDVNLPPGTILTRPQISQRQVEETITTWTRFLGADPEKITVTKLQTIEIKDEMIAEFILQNSDSAYLLEYAIDSVRKDMGIDPEKVIPGLYRLTLKLSMKNSPALALKIVELLKSYADLDEEEAA